MAKVGAPASSKAAGLEFARGFVKVRSTRCTICNHKEAAEFVLGIIEFLEGGGEKTMTRLDVCAALKERYGLKLYETSLKVHAGHHLGRDPWSTRGEK